LPLFITGRGEDGIRLPYTLEGPLEMATQCEGAPMEEVFSKLQHQEGIHLARLKEAYEKFYMSGM
jgi:hypothetical protein